jgi:uncharacterized membrane protein YhaH (DUF805 family)
VPAKSAAPSGGARWPLIAASVVVAVEAAALASSAVITVALIAAGHHAHDGTDAWMVVVLAAIGAIALGWVWRGLARRRRWSRSPAVLVQLLALPVSYNAFGNGAWWLATPLLACAVVGLVGLFAPSSTEALADTADRSAAPQAPRRHSSTSKPSRS